MTRTDSRRLTGPTILLDEPGAVIDVALVAAPEPLIAAWRAHARRMLEALGWDDSRLATRVFPGGVSFALSAPVDALYAATEVNEWAHDAAVADLGGSPAQSFDDATTQLRERVAAERDPAVLALRDAARAHDVTFLVDDDAVSVGTGTGVQTWPRAELPTPDAVGWDRVHDVPVVLVTGSNGKTTTVRLVAAAAVAAGRCVGYSCTDGLTVNGVAIAAGDYSGPEGARRILRDPQVETAVLEVARGGLLRRGLNVPRAAGAAVTNVAVDHFGEYGVCDIETIADVKLLVSRAAPQGPLVINADDPVLAARARRLDVPVTWFGLDTPAASTVSNGWCTLEGTRLVRVSDIPITFGGAARHNVANVLAAVPLARALGVSDRAIREGLMHFASSPTANPGRANVYTIGGVTVLVDFAHNPHGQLALNALARAMPAARRLVIVGQAGDRPDDDIRELARAVWELAPDRIIVKEMRRFLRGRAAGEVPRVLTEALRSAGAPPNVIGQAATEWQAVRAALRWAQPGDLLVLPIQADRTRVLELLDGLARA